MSLAFARLLTSLLHFGNSISNSYTPPSYDDNKKRNFPVAIVIETAQPFQSQEILRPQAQNLSMKPQVCWRPLLHLGNSNFTSYTPPSYDDKQKRNFLVAAVIERAQPFQSQEILRPQAQNLAMKPQVCWRPLLHLGNSIKNYLNYKRLFNSSASSSNPGLPNKANIFFLYASTPG